MTDKAHGETAISAMNDKDIGGRKIKVNEARPRTDRPAGGGGFGGGEQRERRW
jgi:RNA recognition motif-containing protein